MPKVHSKTETGAARYVVSKVSLSPFILHQYSVDILVSVLFAQKISYRFRRSGANTTPQRDERGLTPVTLPPPTRKQNKSRKKSIMNNKNPSSTRFLSPMMLRRKGAGKKDSKSSIRADGIPAEIEIQPTSSSLDLLSPVPQELSKNEFAFIKPNISKSPSDSGEADSSMWCGAFCCANDVNKFGYTNNVGSDLVESYIPVM